MIAVLVIDMQNAFFEDPVLSNCRESVTMACNGIIAAAQESGAKVLLVKTEHEEDKSTWTLNMLEDDQGFIFRGTSQSDFVSGLRTEGLPQMVKTRDSAFLGTDLLLRLRNWNIDTIALVGVSTHNCIAQTAADAFGHNVRVVYAAEATASENPEAAAAVQDILCREYRQQVLSIREIKDRLMAPLNGQEPSP
ncbi:nicotinamidase-related amidase [Pseudarthrobacter oxydans]|uniref:cysteine hydrolase family protein n=1 Tax=Pseudarthrobacter oxydans TaxID=1671 RepID=UPI0027802C53|nr:isochorismatase family cysteine hydrolase [Pseudarthrobacter oxydans]MDP9983559.1 nicotinamidase-related amidase [Pseudarthrobacter oxydans]